MILMTFLLFITFTWYEQKAVIVFLALLSLGIQNIHLGPYTSGFLSPAVTKVLVEKFHIAGDHYGGRRYGVVLMESFYKERISETGGYDFRHDLSSFSR